MKRKSKLLLTLGLALCSAASFAQDANTPAAGETTGASAAAEGSMEAEVVPLIVIDGAPLIEAVKTLARQAGINFILDPRLTDPEPGPDGVVPPEPNVTIRFENVTAEDALVAVLDTYNLIMVKDPRTRVAKITVKDPEARPPLITKTVLLNYASPTNMVMTLTPTLVDSRSRVLPDNRTSQLILIATEKEHEDITELLAELDLPTKQVLIEGNIVETTKTPESLKGIDWTGTLQAQSLDYGNRYTEAWEAGDPVTGVPNIQTIGDVAGLQFSDKGGKTPDVGFLQASGAKAVLSFLNTQTDTEVVSTPRTVTLDNEPATLSVTRAFPIFKITPGSANSPAGAEITYTNLGTILDVTPRIAADNRVALKVVPEVSNIAGQDVQVINGVENIANIYSVRRFETSVLIPSGDTLVMGGLMIDDINDRETKVPLLGDLPGIGSAFRHKSKRRQKSNLMVFITPTILEHESKDHFQQDARDSQSFLQTKIQLPEDIDDSDAWNSAKPHDWKKPVY